MRAFLEKWIVRLWNGRNGTPPSRPVATRALQLGSGLSEDGEATPPVAIAETKRAEHIAVLGKTGTGKSSLLRSLAEQDIANDQGLLFYDVHGDTKDFIVATVAEEEARTGRDLSDRLILIEPGDVEVSVGLNPLEQESHGNRFVQIAEFSQVLRERWHLDTLGARTDELLRNTLYVLADAGYTLVELPLLLTHAPFRASCLLKATNSEVRQYFELRYDPLSPAMQAVLREPILNKTSAFTADPHFRHIVGQTRSTFSVPDALDRGCWIVLDLNKGALGEQSPTLGAVLFTAVKNALFTRRNRKLFTLYVDEVQNIASYDSGIETVLSEARKFAVSVVSANQFLDQYPPAMRSAILSVGSHVFFQLSSADAQQIATALDGGKLLAERLKNLPKRHIVVKTGHEPWREAVVRTVKQRKVNTADLYARCRARWARPRAEIEAEIVARQEMLRGKSSEALDDWE